MFGAAIGAGLSVAGSIFGGISASKAMKKIRNQIKEQQAKNDNWYNRRYNEDVTQRADAQAVLTRVEESVRNRNRQAAGTQAVMGGGDEAVAAAREQNNRAVVDATANIAAAGEQRKDQIEQRYQQRDDQLQGELNAIEAQKAQAIAQATQGGASAGANIANMF